MTDAAEHADRDERFMRIALKEAARARGQTSPNPMVGCVIVDGDEIVARGFHARAGDDHAEIVALRAAGDRAEGAELFVNLEPCSHYGRTPPCVDAIKEAGIRRVVAAMIDPDPRVSGRGMNILNDAGIETQVGVCEQQAKRLNEGFISRMKRERPFVTVKLAMSLDGKIATYSGDSQWISGEESRELVHQTRARSNVITVGPGTASNDNPRLTARPSDGLQTAPPARFVVEGRYRLAKGSNVFDTTSTSTTLFTLGPNEPGRLKTLGEQGVQVVELSSDDPLGVHAVVRQAYHDGAATVLVEGGGEYAGAFFDAGLVDRLMLFVAPKVIGGRDAVTAVAGEGVALVKDAKQATTHTVSQIGDDLLIEADFTEL
jgi:diaminohydroxyphosphoribosylaminopyrimidine deaminase/5-amino-6-(5-phosphoribosylamino)uracil reductase